MEEIISILKSQVDSNPFFQGGFVLGILSYIGYQLKEIPAKLWNWISKFIVYEVYFNDTTDFYNMFTKWYSSKYASKFRRTEVKFTTVESLESKRYDWKIETFQFEDTNFIWNGLFPLIVTKKRDTLENAGARWDRYSNSYTIRGIFANRRIDAICKEVLQLKIEQETGDVLNIDITTTNGNIRKYTKTYKTFNSLFFKNKKELIVDIDTFLSRKKIYNDLGVNHRRGYLLHGPPGTGKSSIITAIAKYTKRDLKILNLAAIKDDSELQMIMMQLPAESVVALEDIDRIFDYNGKILDTINISMSTILNIIGGALTPSDCIFVATCNDLSKLNDALIRSGRFDMHIEVSYPRISNIIEYIDTYFIDLKNTIDQLRTLDLDIIVEMSMSDVEKCLLSDSASDIQNLIIKNIKDESKNDTKD